MYSPLGHRPYHSLLASETLPVDIAERGAHVHIVAISFPVDPTVREREVRCLFLSG